MDGSFIVERLCTRCGRNFIPAPEHMYKDRRIKGSIYCCYTCYLHRGDNVKKKQGKVPKMVAQYTLDDELVRVYQSATQAADHLDCTEHRLRSACNKGYIFKNYKWRYINHE